MIEAKIQVGDYVLSEAQSMAVRVAVSTFLGQLADETFVEDLGPIGPAYKARLAEVERIMVEQCAVQQTPIKEKP